MVVPAHAAGGPGGRCLRGATNPCGSHPAVHPSRGLQAPMGPVAASGGAGGAWLPANGGCHRGASPARLRGAVGRRRPAQPQLGRRGTQAVSVGRHGRGNHRSEPPVYLEGQPCPPAGLLPAAQAARGGRGARVRSVHAHPVVRGPPSAPAGGRARAAHVGNHRLGVATPARGPGRMPGGAARSRRRLGGAVPADLVDPDRCSTGGV